ncbi:hypothetical protein H4I96_03367 [Botrytis cinerea]
MLLYYRYPADLAVPYQRYSSAAYPSVNLYDSDNEPLLSHSHRISALSTSPYASHTYSEHMYAAPPFTAPLTGLVSRLVKKKKDKGKNGGDHKEKTLTKVVYMPKKEYTKHFARGHSGEYIGTEPFRRWSEEELEQTFGKFRPPKRNNGMFWGRG